MTADTVAFQPSQRLAKGGGLDQPLKPIESLAQIARVKVTFRHGSRGCRSHVREKKLDR